MNIRNIAIIAHVDHGKTTLVDQLLKQSGVFRDNEATVERMMDSMDQERERGITIEAKNASFNWKGTKVNIVDTPGHADFGGEVERILTMVDGCLLLVDASEGPLPQTRFVLNKALQHGLKVIVVINKIDRPDSRITEVENEIFDLFIDLDAGEEQMDYKTVYCIARNGLATFQRPENHKEALEYKGTLEPLFDTIVNTVPPPRVDSVDKPFGLLVSNLSHSDFLGRICVGRIQQGSVKVGQPVYVHGRNGKRTQARIQELMTYNGMKQVKAERMEAGDIAALAGVEEVEIGDTIASLDNTTILKRIEVDPPAVNMGFLVNSSPMAGREGKVLLSRELMERLKKEALRNPAIRVEQTNSPDEFLVSGRGELQLAVIVEAIRREGFEVAVGKPKAVLQTVDGVLSEPIEKAFIDLPEEHFGVVNEMLCLRKGKMTNMVNKGSGRVRLDFEIPSRGLIGIRSHFLTATRGTGILNTIFHGYEPYKGDISERQNGAMVADRTGDTVPYGLFHLEPRGTLFIGAGVEVYEGMVIGENARDNDLWVNAIRSKKLTNMRASGTDEATTLSTPRKMTLERCLEWIRDDEIVEVTPKNVRIRKRKLRNPTGSKED
ncbi:MAG TPA: translational GTPase TypA [Bdellovibrionota bacterium]|jgi:GTP-binding protein